MMRGSIDAITTLGVKFVAQPITCKRFASARDETLRLGTSFSTVSHRRSHRRWTSCCARSRACSGLRVAAAVVFYRTVALTFDGARQSTHLAQSLQRHRIDATAAPLVRGTR